MSKGTKDEMTIFMDKLQKEKHDFLLCFVYHVLEEKDVAAAEAVVQKVFRKANENVETVYAHPNPNEWLIVATRDEVRSMTKPEKRKKEKFRFEQQK
ncbi:MAG: hypothetical protein IJZ44_02725 [Lachnospiraceae bacterium]|nr:hypothetical protein [Lachnospiraceae bacterium]